MQAQAMSLEAKRRRDVELIRINAALDRLNKGIFGECLECTKNISLARLKNNPSVMLCLECAEDQEKKPCDKQGF